MSRDYMIARAEMRERMQHAEIMQHIAPQHTGRPALGWLRARISTTGRHMAANAGKTADESVCLTPAVSTK